MSDKPDFRPESPTPAERESQVLAARLFDAAQPVVLPRADKVAGSTDTQRGLTDKATADVAKTPVKTSVEIGRDWERAVSNPDPKQQAMAFAEVNQEILAKVSSLPIVDKVSVEPGPY